ncbi:SulP family inorganic anion transporter [Vagococcus xieshaowenii]|uniref:SulP family inorganic anion transporter n=1 Tax=Vagococcus xieshaowenii TaxID=2562451 RepID=A0AAJ5EGD5_9ENTE|nr:SulP family inorganic anion transporter [Vagococcus xieshaowenii]QCA29240.1 SulP family inorganic anion transporter [Vagococcus xieshaowenii]TFZ43247.1 SulP family inorganic anion transporter [Vagococcus xieshaowenii]
MYHYLNKEDWIGNWKNNLFAGLVSAVAILPEVIGFSILAGVHPFTSLFASAVTLLVITLTGGRPAMVSAAAGSMALVMAPLIKEHGIQYMIAATLLTGLLQLILGYLNIHKLIQFIPKTVMYGFVNALAILIFMSQVQQLPGRNMATYIMVALTVGLMFLIPRITTAVPPALIIIILMTVASFIFKGDLQLVGDLGDMSATAPSLALPGVPLTLETFLIITPPAIALTLVGLTESLLTIPIVDKMTDSPSQPKQEVKAQGLANILVGLFGGPAGCAMIGQAVINVKSGGRSRLSTFVAGSTLLIFLFVLKNLMVEIPTAALIGIMMVVAYDTFDFESLKLITDKRWAELAILILTVAIIVYTHNLALGMIIGVILCVLAYKLKLKTLTFETNEQTHTIKGPLFFASRSDLTNYIDQLPLTNNTTIDLSELIILDDASNKTVERLSKKMKQDAVSIITHSSK